MFIAQKNILNVLCRRNEDVQYTFPTKLVVFKVIEPEGCYDTVSNFSAISRDLVNTVKVKEYTKQKKVSLP
jgi:hypothetical protein